MMNFDPNTTPNLNNTPQQLPSSNQMASTNELSSQLMDNNQLPQQSQMNGMQQQPMTGQTNSVLQQPLTGQMNGTDQGSLPTGTPQQQATSQMNGMLQQPNGTDQGSLPTGTPQLPTGTPQQPVNNTSNTPNQQITPSSSVNKHKYHYFVGYKMQDEAGRFKGLQRFLTNQLNIKNGKMVQDFHIRFAYLGYLDNSVLELFVDKILGSLLETVEKNICEINCTTSRVKIRKKVNSDYAKVVVNLDNDELNKIIKYLVKYGTSKVFDNYNDASVKSAHINLFTFSTKTNDVQTIRKKLTQLQSKKGNGKKVNPISFKVNKIEVLKGIPLARRSGTPSKEDEMTIEVDTDFSYPLREC